MYFFNYNKMHQSLSLLPWKLCIYTYMQYIPDLKNTIKKYYIIVFICNQIKLNSWYVIRQMYNKLNTHVNHVNNRPIQLYTMWYNIQYNIIPQHVIKAYIIIDVYFRINLVAYLLKPSIQIEKLLLVKAIRGRSHKIRCKVEKLA